MLKPKFKDMSDLVAQFNDDIRYLDKYVQKDATLLPLEHKPAQKTMTESVQVESKPQVKAEAVRLSKYSSPDTAVNSFRVLAGLEERTLEPWNPGICAETRTVGQILEDADIIEDGMRDVGGLGSETPHYKKDLGGYSPQAAHKAIRTSERTLSNAHAVHSYMNDLPSGAQQELKHKLARHSEHAAYKLRGATMGAPDHIHDTLHSLADRHERHARIYAKGGRPKLEALEEMQAVIESIDPLDYFDTFVR